MRSTPTALRIFMAGETLTLAQLWKVTLSDGSIRSFTDLDRDIVYDDGTGIRTYSSSTGFLPSAIEGTSELSVNNQNINGILDPSAITDEDLRAGLWDAAEVVIYRVNYRSLAMGHEVLNRGTIGNVTTGRLSFESEIRGLTQALQQQSNRTVQAKCTATFCDDRCKLNVVDFTHSGAVVSVASRQTFGSDLTQDVGVFADGYLTWLTGANAGLKMDIKFFAGVPNYATLTHTANISGGSVTVPIPTGKSYSRDYGVVDSTGLAYKLSDTPSASGDYEPAGAGVYNFNPADEGKSVTITYAVMDYTSTEAGQVDLQLEMPYPISVGDTFNAVEGCDKLIKTCGGRFNNVVNNRSFPHLPGRDRMISGKS